MQRRKGEKEKRKKGEKESVGGCSLPLFPVEPLLTLGWMGGP
jgi:hypothetical protein